MTDICMRRNICMALNRCIGVLYSFTLAQRISHIILIQSFKITFRDTYKKQHIRTVRVDGRAIVVFL